MPAGIRTEFAQATTSTRERFSAWLAPLLGVLVFLPTLRYGFIWDDRYAIVGNESLRSWKTLPHILWGALNPAVDMYRPVTGAILFFQFRFFGLSPWGYHLTSVALHALACALVYRVAVQLGLRKSAAVLASVLFAVHAAHLEAIAWVSAFAEPLVASFVLAGLGFYLHYRQGRQAKWLAAVCLCLFLGLLTKETAMVLPLLFVAYEVWLGNAESRNLRRNIPLIGALSCTVVAYAAMRSVAYTGFIKNESFLPFSTLFFTWPSLLLNYCRHLLMPTPLSPFYDSSYVQAANWSFWLPLLVLIVVAAVAYFCSKRLPNGGLIGFCTTAMAISIIPVLDLNIFQFQEIMHDRFLYLPSVFFSILIGHLSLGIAGQTSVLNRPGKTAASPLYAVLGVSLVVLNVSALLVQSPVWKNDLTLFSYAVRIAPHNPRPAFSLAMEQLERGNLPEAELLLQHTVRLVRAPKALFLLGQTRLRMGNANTAEGPLRQAIAAAPDRPGQHFALGQCLQLLGRTDEASIEFRAEAAIGPDFREPALKKLSELRAGKM